MILVFSSNAEMWVFRSPQKSNSEVAMEEIGGRGSLCLQRMVGRDGKFLCIEIGLKNNYP